VSLVLGGLGLGLGLATGSSLVMMAGWINFVIAAFNLIPALPMDGGRILRATLAKRFGHVRATDIAVTVSRVAAISFAVFGIVGGHWNLLILAPFLWIMGTREKQLAQMMADSRCRSVAPGVIVFLRRE
jgi:Zn-dependent protease